jgi:transposase
VVISLDEQKIIAAYNSGLTEISSLIKDMNNSFNQQISDLNARISELEARINKNSSNSSKPPSSDGYKKPKITNSRKKSEKKTGGQPGHMGVTLVKLLTPDKIIEIPTENFCGCGCDLRDVSSRIKTRQKLDIPKIVMHATEYRVHEKVCPICGKVHKSEFPSGVTQPVEYGENMKALMIYLKDYHFLPLNRTVEAINDITGQKVSEGTIVNASERLYKSLEGVVNEIKEKIKESGVVHCDETGIRSENKLIWLHVASTETLTYYEAHKKRGFEATTDIGILPGYTGTVMHDHWKPLYKYTDCTHAECNAHNIRYLSDIYQNYKQEWANTMISLLVDINRRVNSLKIEGCISMEPTEIAMWQDRYHTIINDGIAEDEKKSPKVFSKKGKLQKSKALKLLFKLQNYDIETLAFMYDFDVPFDNNLAERDLRMQKLRQKISGCFRGENGADVFCRIRSYISTARKRGVTAYEAILNAVKETPSIPEI